MHNSERWSEKWWYDHSWMLRLSPTARLAAKHLFSKPIISQEYEYLSVDLREHSLREFVYGALSQLKEKECRAKRALQAMENGLLRERFIAEHEAALEAMGVPDGYFRYELSLHFQYHSTTRPVDLSGFKARYVHMCTEEQQLHNNNNNNNSKKKKHQEEEEEERSMMMMMNDETSFSTASTPKRAYCVMLENMSATLLSSFSKRAKVAGE
jgi:hypothetical protein